MRCKSQSPEQSSVHKPPSPGLAFLASGSVQLVFNEVAHGPCLRFRARWRPHVNLWTPGLPLFAAPAIGHGPKGDRRRRVELGRQRTLKEFRV